MATATFHAAEVIADDTQFIAGCKCGYTFGGHFDDQSMAYSAIFLHISNCS